MKKTEFTHPLNDSTVTEQEINMALDILMEELRANLERKRFLKNWSVNTLAHYAYPHVSRRPIVDLMQGKGNPSLKTILAVAKTLGWGIRIEFTRP